MTMHDDTAPVLSIVVPLFRESQSLGRLLEQLRTHMKSLGEPFEVILVDDGSIYTENPAFVMHPAPGLSLTNRARVAITLAHVDSK